MKERGREDEMKEGGREGRQEMKEGGREDKI